MRGCERGGGESCWLTFSVRRWWCGVLVVAEAEPESVTHCESPGQQLQWESDHSSSSSWHSTVTHWHPLHSTAFIPASLHLKILPAVQGRVRWGQPPAHVPVLPGRWNPQFLDLSRLRQSSGQVESGEGVSGGREYYKVSVSTWLWASSAWWLYYSWLVITVTKVITPSSVVTEGTTTLVESCSTWFNLHSGGPSWGK